MNTTQAEHIFSNHLLGVHNTAPIIRVFNEQVWPSAFLFACLILLVIIKSRALPGVIRVIQSTFSTQVLQQVEREESGLMRLYSVGLNFFFVLNISFLIYKVNSIYQIVLIDNSNALQFFFFLFTVFVVLLLKFLINSMLAFFTGERRVIMEYVSNSSLVNQAFGLFLFPMVIMAQFSKLNPMIFIVTSVILLAAGILLKWYRGLMRGMIEERIGILQIFSYFCGLEILPVFVLVKYIIESF